MAVSGTDVLYHMTGGAANSDPNLSLGGTISNTQVALTLHDLFDAVSPTEALAGDTEYRAIDVKNNHSTDTLFSAVLWVSGLTTSTSTVIALAFDATGTQSIVNETTAPTGLTFTSPISKATGIALGNIAAAGTKRIWVRRTVTAAAGVLSADAGALTVGGATA
ncbi:MAG: hypothetical protein ABGX83_05235 [Nitrospira sp.]